MSETRIKKLREKRELLWDKWRSSRGGARTRWRIETQIAKVCDQLQDYPKYYENLRKAAA